METLGTGFHREHTRPADSGARGKAQSKRRGQLSGSRGARPQVTVHLEHPGVYHALWLGWAAGLGNRVTLGTPKAGWKMIPDAEASTLQRAKDCG